MHKSMLYASVILLLLSTAAGAQELKFNAVVGADGKIQLVPADNTAPQMGQNAPNSNQSAQNPADLFLWTDKSGAVKGVFNTKAQVLGQTWDTGDTITKYPTSDKLMTGWFSKSTSTMSSDQIKQIAEEASQKLLQSVVDTICWIKPRPDTVSPTVQVSFALFAGGSLSIQATWQTAKVCPP